MVLYLFIFGEFICALLRQLDDILLGLPLFFKKKKREWDNWFFVGFINVYWCI